jgi:hypothetical protein
MKHVGCLEEQRRWRTSLENVPGYCAYPERLRVGYRLCGEKKRGEQSSAPLCHRGVLDQEEDQTVRPLLGLAIRRVRVIGLWMWLDEVMHQVGTRHRQEGEEYQDGTERTETASSPAHLSPPLPAACPKGIHSDTVLTANVMALSVSSPYQRPILAYRLLGSKVRGCTDRHARRASEPLHVACCDPVCISTE